MDCEESNGVWMAFPEMRVVQFNVDRVDLADAKVLPERH